MTTTRDEQVEQLFDQLADLPPDEQRAFLDDLGARDSRLAAVVASLLEADAAGHPAFRHDAGALARDLLADADRAIAGRMGRYVLERFLGEGGMSWVYLARREDLGDLVALKFLHELWSSPAGRRRFAREQTTLAGLRHPAIARLYDAGVTDGRPWFAMEYVAGASIVEHCEHRALDLHARLRLFRDACEAVGYAHRQLVVHLDLKPSNVLVTEEGDVKLLDFGIARHLARDGMRADRTATAHRVLSLNYASPEQIAGEALDVQSDVYSLGALLYQLIAGTVPVTRDQTSPMELAHTLALEPPPVSLRGRARPGVTASASEWRELDAVCAKALSRNKVDRYGSVERLEADIGRFLDHQPLEASVDRFYYDRSRKFLWRHRHAATAAALVLAVLGALVIAFNMRLVAARDAAIGSEARMQRIHRLMLNLFEGDDTVAGPTQELRVVTLLDRGVRDAEHLRDEPDLQAELHYTFGGLYHKLGRLDQAERLLRSAMDAQARLLGPDHPRTIRPRLALAMLRIDQARLDEASPLVHQALAIARRHHRPDSLEVATATAALGKLLIAGGQYGEGLPVLQSAVGTLSTYAPSAELSEALGDLANGLYYVGRISDSKAVNQRALELDRRVFGPRHPHVSVDLYNLGTIALDRAEYREAEHFFRSAAAISEAWYGPAHPKTASHVLMLGQALVYQSRVTEAAPLYQSALSTARAVYGDDHIRVATVLSLMGTLARDHGQLDDAQRHFERAAVVFKARTGPDHEFYLHQLSNLASVDLARGQHARAEATLRRAVPGLMAAVPRQRYTGIARVRLAAALSGQGRVTEAISEAEAGASVLTEVMSPASIELRDARALLVKIREQRP